VAVHQDAAGHDQSLHVGPRQPQGAADVTRDDEIQTPSLVAPIGDEFGWEPSDRVSTVRDS